MSDVRINLASKWFALAFLFLLLPPGTAFAVMLLWAWGLAALHGCLELLGFNISTSLESSWYVFATLSGYGVAGVGFLIGFYFWFRIQSLSGREFWQCTGCGYDLRGSGRRCPECGLEQSSIALYEAEQYHLMNETDGFTVRRDDQVLFEVKWSQLRRIETYKLDLWSYDMICLSFDTIGGQWYEIQECMDGFREITKEMEARFKTIPEDWYLDVMLPAFAANQKVLWQQAQLGEHSAIR